MIIVTGGAGFIGSNLIKELEARKNHKLVVCDYLGVEEKWKNIAKRELADIIKPDVLFDYLNDHAKDVEKIFHMGAISATTERNADQIVSSNIHLTMKLWNWCSKNETTLIYASSAATYGDGSSGFSDEDSTDGLAKLRPLNLYGWSKHAVDRRIAQIVQEQGPQPPHWAGLKFFNVYGPNEYHKKGQLSVVLKNYREISDTGKALLFRSNCPEYADGEQKRDFVWVGDCVNIALWLSENSGGKGIYNVGTGKARTFKELASAVFDSMDLDNNIEFIEMPEVVQKHYQYFTEADISRIRALGYRTPTTELEDGIKQYLHDYLMTADPYA
tara:strand:+ start:181 stop:1167 length:987 start_codon:yes stop_codon:yes gene_type:complete